MAAQQAPRRRVGDTLTPLFVTINQKNNAGVSAAYNLTGLTVKFKMVNAATGAEKIAATETGVTVETAASGTVKYDFSSGGVDAAGKFYGSFIVISSAENDHAPPEHDHYVILIDSDTQTAEEAYEAAVEA
jgi:hypothetical protein